MKMFRSLIVLSLLLVLSAPVHAAEPAPEVKSAPIAAAEIPPDQPNMDDAALLSWAASAASDVLTFNYTDYQRRLQQSSRRFTKAGWETFAAALQRSRIIEAVIARNQEVSAQPGMPPVIVQEGPVEGVYRFHCRACP